jgi:hypothetical protein
MEIPTAQILSQPSFSFNKGTLKAAAKKVEQL